jgi:polysaccharide deacetylase family protein (PEP-CTERM system associated)
MKNALSIDLEDWYHPEFVRRHVTGIPEPQITDSTVRILELLDKYNVKATFFILGEVAEKDPELVRKIYKKGHEIASHGMSHRPLWELDYDEFDKELKSLKTLLNKTLGRDIKIRGFRAPTFSIDNRTKYALKCLIDNGYEYDSSVFPAKNYMYGVKGAPCSIYKPSQDDLSKKDNDSCITEFPLTVLNVGRIRIPVSGGFYLRVLPYFLLKAFLRIINKTRPFVIYFHPWETFHSTPRIKGIGRKERFIIYFGINNCLDKIKSLIRDFEFGPVGDIIDRKIHKDLRVRDYFENCAERFDSFYRTIKRSFFQHAVHVTLRKPSLVRRFQATVDILGDIDGRTVLDAGCGSGIYSRYFAKKGAKLTGIDFSKSMIALARRNAEKEGCKVDFRIDDLLKYETQDRFDFSLLIGVFDYVKKDEIDSYFEKVIPLTKEKIIVTFPKKFTLHTPIRYIWLKRQNCPVYFYNKKQIRTIAERFGLRVRFYNCGSIWTVEFGH